MRRHLAYLKYVLRHKLFVFVAMFRIGGSPWKALTHDISKFLPSEWIPYARCFYAPDGSKQYQESDAFNMAWLKHQHRNPHHYQHWVLKHDDGHITFLEMPVEYVVEMLADWTGAGMAIHGRKSPKSWYEENKSKIFLHSNTRGIVEEILNNTKLFSEE